MVLRKLTIYGFKSFADKTEIRFGDGMTAVIGPNGCGKSNVVDAVRWVFGEQKASALRSTSMQDVIFSGTQKRQPLNVAEVTLVIENTRGILPLEYREVAVTRRAYRSGDSEYLLNRSQCRLRDIQNLFLDTGLGSNCYTTIENGMINSILSDKAEERRILFEEAAGISKYKKRIKEAQRKLERTGQDLLRISDRVQEKERYVRMLARQGEKARRYKKYRDDLMTLELGLENRRYTELGTAIANRERELAELTQEYETARAKIASNESRIEELEVVKVEKENELQIAGRNVADAGEKINAIDREVSVSNQSLSLHRENVERFEQEARSFEAQTEEKREFLGRIERSIIERESQLREQEEHVGEARTDLETFDGSLSSHRSSLDELADSQLGLVHGIGDEQKALSTSQTNLTNAQELRDRLNHEIQSLRTRMEEYREAMEQCRLQLESESEAHKNHLKSREALWIRLEKEDERYHELVEKEKGIEARIDSCKAQLRFLEGLDSAYEGYESGVKALLTRGAEGTMGIVADLLEVKDAQIAALVERALGPDIQTVVFRTDAALEDACTYLKSEKVGSARMMSLERLTDQPTTSATTPLAATEPLRGHVIVSEECSPLADRLLGHILIADTCNGRGCLVDGLPEHAMLVTRDGVVSHGTGLVVAGESTSEEIGILQRKQQREELSAEILRCGKVYEDTVHQKENCIITRDEVKRALVEVDEKINRGRQKQREQETNITHYQNEIQNTRDRAQSMQPELSRTHEAIAEHEAAIRSHETALQEMVGQRQDIEGRIAGAKARLAEMEEERGRLADHLRNIELSLNGLTNRLEQERSSVERLKKDIDNLTGARQRKLEDKNKTLASIAELESSIARLNEELSAVRQRRRELEEIHAAKREEYNGILNQIEEIRKESKTHQEDLQQAGNRRHEHEVEQTRAEEKRRTIRERMWEAYQLDLESPPEDLPLLEQIDDETVQNIETLKERLRRVGDVNLGALQEYEVENEELKKMVAQRDDLQKAVDDLEKAIRKLNKEARVQFVQTFDQVKENFQKMFLTLFEGGEARLSLEEDVDPLQAAIRIDVRPAGKTMRGVTLLSGGERALTAISLLFALYMVKPSAYCILDELDAPLDDANIGRFVRILRQFAESTQFVVITHNKRTMEAADLLYGVTQQESGVSTVASLSLDEVDAKAA